MNKLSHALGLSVVVEGVESASEQGWLAEHGCDLVQGYGIALPMPAQELLSCVPHATRARRRGPRNFRHAGCRDRQGQDALPQPPNSAIIAAPADRLDGDRPIDSL